MALSNTRSGGSSGGAALASTTLFGDDGDEEIQVPTLEEYVEQLSELIRDTVGYTSEWAAKGGTQSSIRERDGKLVVTTTAENHRRISDMLEQLYNPQPELIHLP